MEGKLKSKVKSISWQTKISTTDPPNLTTQQLKWLAYNIRVKDFTTYLRLRAES